MDEGMMPPKRRGRPKGTPQLRQGPTPAERVEMDGLASVVAIPRPRINVLERSIQHPFGIPENPVELTDAGLVCRWVNTELKGGAQFQYALSHGWLQVRAEYLKNPKLVPHVISADGYVCRGARNGEILMYTTVEHFRNRQLAKQRENDRQLQPHIVKQETVEAASTALGDEAASYLHDHIGPVGEVRTQKERIQVDPHEGD